MGFVMDLVAGESREVLLATPQALREAALALGATKAEAIGVAVDAARPGAPGLSAPPAPPPQAGSQAARGADSAGSPPQPRSGPANQVAELQPPPFAGHEVGHVDRFLHVAARFLEDLPHLPGHFAGNRLLVAFEDGADGIEKLGAFRRGRQAPGVVRAAGRFHSGVHIIAIRFLKCPDQIFAVGGIAILERLPRRRANPFAIDVVLVFARRPQFSELRFFFSDGFWHGTSKANC